jgi:hypothetical protein
MPLPGGNIPWCPVDRKLGGQQALTGQCGEQTLLTLLGTEPRFLCHCTNRLIPISTELLRLLVNSTCPVNKQTHRDTQSIVSIKQKGHNKRKYVVVTIVQNVTCNILQGISNVEAITVLFLIFLIVLFLAFH